MSDAIGESVSYFLGPALDDINLSKLESYLSDDTMQIREVEQSGTAGTRKYLSILLENLVNAKSLSQREILLLLHACSCGILKIIEETMWHPESGSAQSTELGDVVDGSVQALQDRLATVHNEYEAFKEEKMLELYQQSKRIGELLSTSDEQAGLLNEAEGRVRELESRLSLHESSSIR